MEGNRVQQFQQHVPDTTIHGIPSQELVLWNPGSVSESSNSCMETFAVTPNPPSRLLRTRGGTEVKFGFLIGMGCVVIGIDPPSAKPRKTPQMIVAFIVLTQLVPKLLLQESNDVGLDQLCYAEYSFII